MSKSGKYRVASLLLLLGGLLSGYLFLYQLSHSKIAFKNLCFSSAQYLVFPCNASSLNTTKRYNCSAAQNRNASQFVSFHESTYDGRRLGNQLFDFAAVVFVAELTGRRPVLKNCIKRLGIEAIFQLNLERVDDLCPSVTIGEAKHLSYDQNTEMQIQKAGNNSILISGFRQSWKYTMTIEHRLRRHLVFNDEIKRFAEDFLTRNIPPGWEKTGFVRVGIHVRRGDNVRKSALEYGYTVANASYFENAMKFFIDRYSRVQFIAMSDDRNWTTENIVIPKHLPSTVSVNVTYSVRHSSGQDLAIMSLCDHVIMSTGTFGWWGAWLAKGTTIYYKDWPRLGSPLYNQFKRNDFFPPSWIPMTS